MKRLSRKGFMMAEVIVVAAVVLGVLTSIYTSYNKVFVRYKQLLSYYNVDGVYKLANIRDEMIATDDSFINRIKVDSGKCNYYTVPGVSGVTIALFIINAGDLGNSNLCNEHSAVDDDFLNYMRKNIKYEGKTNRIIFFKWKENNKFYWNYLELEA